MSIKINRNLIGVLSVVIATLAFQYNAWRTEKNEINDNTRTAAFNVLAELARLQVLVGLSYYSKDNLQERRIKALGHIVLVRNLSYLLPADVQSSAKALYQVWKVNEHMIYKDKPSTQAVSNAIQNTQASTLASLSGIM